MIIRRHLGISFEEVSRPESVHDEFEGIGTLACVCDIPQVLYKYVFVSLDCRTVKVRSFFQVERRSTLRALALVFLFLAG